MGDRINDYIRCPICGFFHITRYTLKAGRKRRVGFIKDFTFDISLDEEVVMMQKRMMIPAGRNSEILILEERNLHALPDYYKAQLIKQCQAVIDELKRPGNAIQTAFQPTPKQKPPSKGVSSAARRKPGFREEGSSMAQDQVDILQDAIRLAESRPDPSLTGLKNQDGKESIENVMDRLKTWSDKIENMTRQSKLDRAVRAILRESSEQLDIALGSQGKNPTDAEISAAMKKAIELLEEIAEERVDTDRASLPPSAIAKKKPGPVPKTPLTPEEKAAEKVRKAEEKARIKAEVKAKDKAMDERALQRIAIFTPSEDLVKIDQYDSGESIQKALEYYGELTIGEDPKKKQVPFGIAWTLWPRLVTEARQGSIFIIGWREPRERPSTGIFASPPTFDFDPFYMNAREDFPNYARAWKDFYQKELFGQEILGKSHPRLGEIEHDPLDRPSIFGDLIHDRESVIDRAEWLVAQPDRTKEDNEELEFLEYWQEEIDRMMDDIEPLLPPD